MVRSFLLILAAVLMCSVVALDHYRLSTAFYEFDLARDYHTEQLASFAGEEQAINFAKVSQEIANIQTKRVDDLLETLKTTSALLNETRDYAARLLAAVDASAKQLSELIDDNAALQSQIDTNENEIQALRDKLEAVTKELEEARKVTNGNL
jgi:chromosome segregation ATPase